MFYVGWIPDKLILFIWIHQTVATKTSRVSEITMYHIITKIVTMVSCVLKSALKWAGNERISSHVNQSQRSSFTCYLCHYCPFPHLFASQSARPFRVLSNNPLPARIQRQQWLAISGDMEKPTVSDGTSYQVQISYLVYLLSVSCSFIYLTI